MNKDDINKQLAKVEKDLTFATSKHVFSKNKAVKNHFRFQRNRLYNEKIRLQNELKNSK